MSAKPFKFKHFTIEQDRCAMKIGTDGVLLGAWSSLAHQPESILDIGTGTGILSLTSSKLFNSTAMGIDIDAESISQANSNLLRNNSIKNTSFTKLELEEVNNFYHKKKLENRLDTVQSAISHAVFRLTSDLDINAVVVMTESGSTCRFVSSYRPKAPIFALSPYESICRQMSIIWGVVPLKVDSLIDTDKMIGVAEKILKRKKMIQKNQLFVITAGVPVGVVGTTNMLKVHKIT